MAYKMFMQANCRKFQPEIASGLRPQASKSQTKRHLTVISVRFATNLIRAPDLFSR